MQLFEIIETFLRVYLEKDLSLKTNVYDAVLYWIVQLIKNVLYLTYCGYAFRILVVNKTYIANLLGLLIPSRVWFIHIVHVVHGHWHSIESNLLISSLWSWLKYYLHQIISIYPYIYLSIYLFLYIKTDL